MINKPRSQRNPVKFGVHRQQVEPICPTVHARSCSEKGIHVPPFLHVI